MRDTAPDETNAVDPVQPPKGWVASAPVETLRRTVELAPAAWDALQQAQQAVTAAQAHLDSLLTGIVAASDIRSGHVVAVHGRTLVVEVGVNGGGSDHVG